jgi:dihydropteroate synthase
MQKDPSYEALVPEVLDYLRGSIAIASDAGIRNVIIDPGIGFGKTFDQNLELINSLPEFVKLGLPVLVGPSRKAFIGAILGGAPPTERMEGTAAVVAACVLGGAHIIRVHDVREMNKVVRVAYSLRSGRAA